jgi:CBS domain-containing protein
MPFSRAGQLAHSVPTARLTDPLGLVAENLRNAPHGVLPVLDRSTFGEGDPSEREARVVGLIDIRDLASVTESILAPVYANGYANGHANGHSNGHACNHLNGSAHPSFENLTARDVMRADVPYISAHFTLLNALSMLDRTGLPALPVLDEVGRYRGIVSRADVLAAMSGAVRPPMVGGMATPLGVWLTNGTLTGGAPPLGLFLSGLTLAFCYAFAQILLVVGLWAINPALGAAGLSGRLGIVLDGSGLLNTSAFVAQSLLFLLLMRAVPLAGIHAAEHQTVWAMERGLPLEIEYVEKMPRAHPRCGTNLIALVGLVTIGLVHIPEFTPDWILLVLAITFFGWRSLGTLLQEWFTTRPASRKQLESGIKAAKELMEKYQAQPYATPGRPLRLLNNGMVYSAAGMILGTSVLFYLMQYVGSRIMW